MRKNQVMVNRFPEKSPNFRNHLFFALITLAKQKEPVWKWRKRFAKTPVQLCSLKEEGVVNVQTENVAPFEAFSKCIGLPGLLSMMKIEN